MNALIQAKKEFSNLYYAKIDDSTAVVFRGLKWGDFKSYRSLLISVPNLKEDIIEDIFKECLVEISTPGIHYSKYTKEQEEYNSLDNILKVIPAGIVVFISEYIMSISGAMEPISLSSDLDALRIESQVDIESRITSAIATVFRLTQSDFDNMEWHEVLSTITQGELILSGQIPEVPFTIESQEQTAKPIDFEKENRQDIG